jgi:hypothetical protein
MTPNTQEKPPPYTEPDMQTSGGETDPGEDDPDHVPTEPSIGGDPKGADAR